MLLTAHLRHRVLEPMWSRYAGTNMLSAWRDLERSQYLSRCVLEQRQWLRLTQLLEFAYARNDYYRERFDAAGVDPRRIDDPRAFRRVPILTKRDVRAAGSSLLSQGFDPTCLMTAKTGGSTGQPLSLFFTEEVSQQRNASGRRHRRWTGWEVGEPVGYVWGNPVHPTTLRGQIRQWVLAPTIYLDTMSVTAEAVRTFSEQWSRVRPTLLFGHAHSLFLLASLARELDVSEIRPKAIISTSMMLLPHERRAIERQFGVTVTDSYGCEEVGQIASECERHEGLHVNVDQVFVEILRDNGTPAEPGETGMVVVTDLLNRAMPLIRYRIEDMAEVPERPCSCPRGLPTLRRIVGRTADFLVRTDDSRVAGISLIENTLTRIPGVDQMQIEQTGRLRIVLRVVVGNDFTAHRQGELVSYFETIFPSAAIVLERVDRIPAEPNGKYRFSICRVG